MPVPAVIVENSAACTGLKAEHWQRTLGFVAAVMMPGIFTSCDTWPDCTQQTGAALASTWYSMITAGNGAVTSC